MDMRFYRCEHCGNIIAMVKDAGVSVMCCDRSQGRLCILQPARAVEGVEVKE